MIIERRDNSLGKNIVARFYGLPELFKYIRDRNGGTISFGGWGGGSAEEGMKEIERGNAPLARRIEELMQEVDATVSGRERREYVPGVAGSFPVVADYLAGMPLNMRRRAPVESEQAPIRLIVETATSAGVSKEQLENRGAAIAALVSRLSETRAIELWTLWGSYMGSKRINSFGLTKIDTLPVDINSLGAVFSSTAYARSIEFAGAMVMTGDSTGNINWNWKLSPTIGARIAAMRTMLDMDPADIFLPGGYTDDSALMMHDPVAWVNKYLDSQRGME